MPHHPKPFFKKARRVWYVEIDRHQINLGSDKDAAFRRYHQLMADSQTSTREKDALVVIIDAFLEWTRKHRAPDTYEWYRHRLQRFAETYPNLRTDQLRTFHVQEWLDAMTGLSSGSKRNHCRAIKRCLRWAEQQGRIDRNPIAHMEQPKGGKRDVVFSQEQFDDLLASTADRNFRDLMIVTWETGCRPQESLRVEARHVDLANQRWVFPASEAKTDSLRVVYLTDTALAITRRLMLSHSAGPLFRNSRGEAWTTGAVNCAFTRLQIRMGRRLLDQRVRSRPKDRRRKRIYVDDNTVADFTKMIPSVTKTGRNRTRREILEEARRILTNREAMRVAPKCSLYALRHSWATHALERGLDGLTVAILMGHQDPSTLAKVYQHLSHNPAHLLAEAKRAAAG